MFVVMKDVAFLKDYDPAAFERPSVAVDLVLLTIRDARLHVLLVERDEPPGDGEWGLPGTFVQITEDLDAAAHRVLQAKTTLAPRSLEQLYTFGAVDRDPRLRVISIAYFGLVPASVLAAVCNDQRDLAEVRTDNECVQIYNGYSNEPLELAFDHHQIVATAVERLRAKLDWSEAAFDLLPPEFALRELQHVHEVVLGRRLNKPAFRKRMLASDQLVTAGRRENGGSAFRPAELYRRKGAG